MYYFDSYGWLTAQPIDGRSTSEVPPVETDTLKANWTGTHWVLVTYTAPRPYVPPVVIDPCADLIDIGPFFDRTGTHKIPILSDPDAVVQAIVKDVMSRKWVTLTRADVAQAVDLLISKGHAVDKAAMLKVPVLDAENFALRKLYFS